MDKLRLVCVRVGDGGVAEVDVDFSWTVLDLKENVKHKLFRESEKVLASDLKLFLATCYHGRWLETETELAGHLASGGIPAALQTLVNGEEQTLPTETVKHWLETTRLPLPSSDQIHVLVFLPPKRRRLDNAEPPTEVARISIHDAAYVTLSGELVANCGLYAGGDLTLYCRRQVHELWAFLRDEVVAKNTRGWILGPPGTGKSVGTLSFLASFDQEEWSVIWIHLDEMGDFCLSMKAKQHWLVDDRSTFELHRHRNEKLFVCLDGYQKCEEHAALLRRIRVRFIKETDRFVVCSAMATRGLRDVESDAVIRIKPFVMYSWTLDEYAKAVSDPAFYDQVAPMLDTKINSDVDDDGGEEVNTLSQEDQQLRLLRLKFYYAGGSCRFMFQYPKDLVKQVVQESVLYVDNKVDLPVDWSQGGYDAVYVDTQINKVVFVQVNRSDKATIKLRLYREVLVNLRAAGMKYPAVEIFFIVRPNQLEGFSFASIDDRGAIEEFDKRWTGTEEDRVKIRAFKAIPAQNE